MCASIDEWFANGPLGLEQGFTVPQRPTGGDGSPPLAVVLGLGGDLHAEVNTAGDR